MIHHINEQVCITPTGDPYIDQYEGLTGTLVRIRTISERGYPTFEQVLIRYPDGQEIWVNENEYEASNDR